MPYDSNGNFSLTPGYLAVDGQTILPSQHNPVLEDLGSGMSQVVLRSGVAPMSGNLRMNGFKVVGSGAASLPDDLTTKAQLDDAIADIVASDQTLSTHSGDVEALDANYNTVFRFTAPATFSIDDAANLRDDWTCEVWPEGGTVVIDPDGSQTINGLTTLAISQGQRAKIFKASATTFRASLSSDSFSGPPVAGHIFGLTISANASDPANDVDIAVGNAASDGSYPYLLQLASVLTKRIDSSWSVGNNNGGLDAGSVQATATYYVWLIQRSDTQIVDALFSTSATSPTMPAGYDRKRLIGVFYRRSSVNAAHSSESQNKQIGVNQTWQDVTGPRSVGVTYQNDTGKPIQLAVRPGGAGTIQVSIDGSTWLDSDPSPIIPNAWFYRQSGGTISTWLELR